MGSQTFHPIHARRVALLGWLAVPVLATSAHGAVSEVSATGFTIEVKAHVRAPPKEVYAVLISPSRWWSPQHTFSGDASKLNLEARAGGCWCESLADGGSTQHLTVVYVAPGKTLRLRGALGPFQGAGVEGAMTWSLGAAGNDTELSLTYALGGHRKDGFEEWSRAADSVLSEQVDRLKAVAEGRSADLARSPQVAAPNDTSPHKTEFVTVDKDVRLEVLDWGGTGRPLVLLTGQAANARIFDEFALNFTARHHVYGITRRGYGLSDKPAPTAENYDANRLGDDVLAVIDALKLDRPYVAGHSIAGEELSSIGTRRPERVAGLIYLDAHGPAAFYDPATGSYGVEMAELLRRLKGLSFEDPTFEKARLRELLQSGLLQRFDHQAELALTRLETRPPRPANARLSRPIRMRRTTPPSTRGSVRLRISRVRSSS